MQKSKILKRLDKTELIEQKTVRKKHTKVIISNILFKRFDKTKDYYTNKMTFDFNFDLY